MPSDQGSFADAVARARAVAAKIMGGAPPATSQQAPPPTYGGGPSNNMSDSYGGGPSSDHHESRKRHRDRDRDEYDDRDRHSRGKRHEMDSHSHHHSSSHRDRGMPLDPDKQRALKAAQETAARINRRNASSGSSRFQGEPSAGGIPPVGIATHAEIGGVAHTVPITIGGAPGVGAGGAPTEMFNIPENMVGLVIGKGGETISRIQNETGATVRIGPEGSSTVPGERSCILSGSPEQIARVKVLIDELVHKSRKSGGHYIPPGQTSLEIMVPGVRVGMVIGRGGENIRNLQERYGVKMMLIQDDPTPGADKPLKITGPQAACEEARQVVVDMIDQQNQRSARGGGGGGFHHRGGDHGNRGGGEPPFEYIVPANKAGLVIGRGGDTIRDINNQSGAHVEVSRNQPDPDRKVFLVHGSYDQIQTAVSLINERAGLRGPGPAPGGGGQNGQWSGTGGQGQQQNQGWQQQEAWAQFYNQMYSGGPGGQQQQGSDQQKSTGESDVPAPSVNPVTGQADYSDAWAQYYRSQGMNEYADAIIAQAKAQKQGIGQQKPQPPQMTPEQQLEMARSWMNQQQQGQNQGQGTSPPPQPPPPSGPTPPQPPPQPQYQ